MKQGWAFAWRSLMAAEIYVTILTGFGLGHLLHYGRELSAMDQVIGIMLVIVHGVGTWHRAVAGEATDCDLIAIPRLLGLRGNEADDAANSVICDHHFQFRGPQLAGSQRKSGFDHMHVVRKAEADAGPEPHHGCRAREEKRREELRAN
jgi:hypothetical protein